MLSQRRGSWDRQDREVALRPQQTTQTLQTASTGILEDKYSSCTCREHVVLVVPGCNSVPQSERLKF